MKRLGVGGMREVALYAGGILLVVALLHLPVTAATIVVDGPCTLIDAINAANDDDDAGGLCPPGGSGADTLELTGDVTLTALNNTSLGGNGLPVIQTNISIAGNGFAVERDVGAPDFRLLYVNHDGTLALEGVTLRGGVATEGERATPSGFYGAVGGAIAGRYGTIILSESTLEGNSADSGGAFFGYVANLVLYNSTIAGNSAAADGGGIGAYLGYVTATNSTISGNSALNYGGGVFGGYSSDLTLVNTTIAANSAGLGGGISNYGLFGGNISSYGSVIGYNTGGNCAVYPINNGEDNLDNDGTCGATFGALTGLDPTLADNGGTTETHALLAGSTAIDLAGACGLPSDQRSFARDALCDTGSVEFGVAPVGGSPRGVQVRRVACRNTSTAQVVTILDPEVAWDCEAVGLAVSPGDRIRQIVEGRSLDGDVGATAISVGQLRTRCSNQTTGQQIRFEPEGTNSWSCTAEGLGVEMGDRIVQIVDGVAH